MQHIRQVRPERAGMQARQADDREDPPLVLLVEGRLLERGSVGAVNRAVVLIQPEYHVGTRRKLAGYAVEPAAGLHQFLAPGDNHVDHHLLSAFGHGIRNAVLHEVSA